MIDPTKPAPQLLTVAQAAAELQVSSKTLRRHIEKGALEVERIGPFRRIRIRRDVLARYASA